MNARTTQSRSPRIPTTAPHDDNAQQQAMDAEAALKNTPYEPPSRQMRHLYADCNATTGMIYTDPKRRFMTSSVSFNQYMPVVYEYDGNCINSETMIDRTGPSIIVAYKNRSSILNLADSNLPSNDWTMRHHWPFSR
jgi:hypothetical protein